MFNLCSEKQRKTICGSEKQRKTICGSENKGKLFVVAYGLIDSRVS
jgi:hypothetical protein